MFQHVVDVFGVYDPYFILKVVLSDFYCCMVRRIISNHFGFDPKSRQSDFFSAKRRKSDLFVEWHVLSKGEWVYIPANWHGSGP